MGWQPVRISSRRLWPAAGFSVGFELPHCLSVSSHALSHAAWMGRQEWLSHCAREVAPRTEAPLVGLKPAGLRCARVLHGPEIQVKQRLLFVALGTRFICKVAQRAVCRSWST